MSTARAMAAPALTAEFSLSALVDAALTLRMVGKAILLDLWREARTVGS